MAKQGGMGDGYLVDGFDLAGDTSNVTITAPMQVQDITPISAYGNARLGLAHDGSINWGAFWNPSSAGAGTSAHEVLRTLPTADRIVTYLRSTVLGAPAASLVTKQIDYAPTRNPEGSFVLSIDAQSNGYGMEWGAQLTAGLRTEAAAGNGPTVDLGAGPPVSYSFGWAAYLQVNALTGTSVTVKVQDSADGATWADLSGATFAAATGRAAQRLASASLTATVRRYLRVVSAGTYTNAIYAVNFVRYEAAGHP
jgi:hypothetical protein